MNKSPGSLAPLPGSAAQTKPVKFTGTIEGLKECPSQEKTGRLTKPQVRLLSGAGKRKHGSVQEIIMYPITRRFSVLEVRIRLLHIFLLQITLVEPWFSLLIVIRKQSILHSLWDSSLQLHNFAWRNKSFMTFRNPLTVPSCLWNSGQGLAFGNAGISQGDVSGCLVGTLTVSEWALRCDWLKELMMRVDR